MPEDAVTEHLEKNETDRINAKELMSMIKNLYAEYEVSAYIQDCTYFYQQKWIFSMKDVLRTRREMFGLTQEQLCEGICSVKSLRRAEKGQTDMQRETLKKLLNRLGLSGQMQWSRLITSDRKVIRMAEKLAGYINDRKFSVASKQLESLKSRIDLDIPQNKQYFLEKQALLEFEQGKVTREEFVKMEKDLIFNKSDRITAYDLLSGEETEILKAEQDSFEWMFRRGETLCTKNGNEIYVISIE